MFYAGRGRYVAQCSYASSQDLQRVLQKIRCFIEQMQSAPIPII